MADGTGPSPGASLPPLTPESLSSRLALRLSAAALPAFAGPNSARLSTARASYHKPTSSLAGSRSSRSARSGLTDTVSGELDVWPLATRTSQPQFLTTLQEYLEQELAKLGPHSTCENRLQIYRELFEHLLQHFRVYQPILAAIKGAYEEALEQQARQLRLMHPLQSRLATVRSEADHALKQLQLRHAVEVEQMRAELGESDKSRRHLQMENELLRLENEEMKEQLHAQETQILELKESRSALYKAIKRVQDERDFHRAEDAVDRTTRAMLAKQLSDTKDELMKTLRELDQRNAELAERVSRQELTDAQSELTRVQTHLGALKKTYQTLMAEHHALLQRLREETAQREKAEAERDALRAGGAVPASTGATAAGAVGEGDEARSQSVTADTFESRGTGSDVPKYLRYPAGQRIRNRNFAKRDTEKMIKDLWLEKVKYDKAHSQRENMETYFALYLQQKYGIPTVMAEYAYSFVDALERYSYDPDCDMCLKVLQGELEEEVYHDQMEVLCQLQAFVRRQAIKEAGRESELISRDALLAGLRKFFPGKSEAAMSALQKTLNEHDVDGMIRWGALFEEDREGNQCEFMETLRQQHIEERTEYISAIEMALKDQYSSKTITSPDEYGKLNLGEIRAAFAKVDPNKRDSELDEYLARGFGVSVRQLRPDLTIVITEFIRRLKRGVVRRSTRKESVDRKAILRKPSIFFTLPRPAGAPGAGTGPSATVPTPAATPRHPSLFSADSSAPVATSAAADAAGGTGE